MSIRYSSDPVPFDAIYNWIYSRAHDIIAEHAPREAFVVDVIALTFERTSSKPEKIEVKPLTRRWYPHVAEGGRHTAEELVSQEA